MIGAGETCGAGIIAGAQMAGVRGLNRPVCRPHPSPILKELVHLEKRNVEKTQDMLSRSNQASMFLCKENLATVLSSVPRHLQTGVKCGGVNGLMLASA